MSVKIRLAKVGKSHQISYRIVAQDTHSKRDGKFLAILGFYNPHNQPELKMNKEEADKWLKNGATLTPAVNSLMTEGKLTKKPNKKKAAAKAKLKEEAAKAAEAAQAPVTPAATQEAPKQEEAKVEAAAEPQPSAPEPEPKTQEAKAEPEEQAPQS